MRIFALQTDVNEVKKRFCHEGERVVYMTYFHGLSFFFAIVREVIITMVFLTLAVFVVHFDWFIAVALPILSLLWLFMVVLNVLKAYIDWFFDFIMVTTDKVIMLDQSSIFKQVVKPIHVENIGGISTSTQFWDMFPFGQLTIHLKEGLGGDTIVLKYVPRVREVAGAISEVVTRYQRHNTANPASSTGQNLPKSFDLGTAQNAQ